MEWISVKDRLPDKEGYYFVVVDKLVASKLKGRIEIGDCYKSIAYPQVILKFQDYVTHWLPLTALPNPPEVEK